MNPSIYWLLDQQYVTANKSQLPEVSFMDKMIENFSCSKNDEYLIEGTMGMPLPPFVASFSTDLLDGNMLGVADEDGHVKLIDTSKTKSSSIIKEWSAHSNAVFDLAWIEKQAKMVTASGDQTARLWDIEKCDTIGNFRGHTRSLKSIAVQPRSSYIFLTSARDGDMMLWDTRCNMRNGYHTPINIIRQAHERAQLDAGTSSAQKKKRGRRQSCQGDLKQSVTAAVFLDDCRIISSGACDGALKYWDIRKNYSNVKGEALPRHVINFSGKGPRKHGFSSLVLNSTCSRVFSICTNNIIYEFPTTNLASRPIATYQGHHASSFYVKAAISPDDRYLLCGSGDNSAYIWRTDQANAMPWVLSGHDGEVTSVAWSPNDGDKIVTCSDDNTFKVWRLFQDSSDPLSSSGTVQRKSKMEDSTIGEISGDVVLHEDVLEYDIPEKKVKCFCRKFNMVSNGKVRVRWNNGVVHHAKDTVCNMPVQSKAWNSSSPYTVITPKSDKCPTPTQTLGEKMDESQSITHPAHCKDAMTPKSSRIFMETWLKSPEMSGKMLHGNKPEDTLQTPDKNVIGTNLKHTPGTEDDVHEMKQKPSNFRNQKNKVACKLLKYENIEKKTLNKEARVIKPEVVSVVLKPAKSTPKKVSARRTKKAMNSQGCGNIKTLFLSMKHKADSSNENENCNTKRLKSEEEGLGGGVTPTLTAYGDNKMDLDGTSDNKENSLNGSVAYEASKDNTLPPQQTPVIALKEKPVQSNVRDVLDIAEDSTTL